MQRLGALTIFLFALSLLGSPVGIGAVRAASAEEVSEITPAPPEQPAKDEPAKKSGSSEESKTDKSAAKSEEKNNDQEDSDESQSADEDSEDEEESDKKTEEDAAEAEKPEDKSDKPKKKAEKQPKPHKVKRDELKVEVELDGIFVADEMEEVALRPEVWSTFKILEAIEHGATVEKGEVLIRFDDEKLEKDLAKESLNQSIGQLSLLQVEEELPRIKRLQELAFEEAERRRDQTKADYDYYHATDRPFTVEITHFRFKSATEQLASAQEELDQLQQMYEADELTEETEEIVLRRQRFAVETAKLVLEVNKENRDYTLNVALPRRDQSYETALEESELAYKQAKTALEMGKTRKNYDMEKKRKARAESVERHGKLLSDKALMVLRAPCDGVVYYGRCTNGKWSQVASLKTKLKPFGSATPNSVLMTIVKPGSLHIESNLGEKELPDVKVGLQATIIPAADKALDLEGKIAQVDAIPGASNKFQVDLEVDLSNAPEWLVAGMTCEAKVVVYENKQAIVVPLAMVQTDEDDDKIKYVMVLGSGEDRDETVRRNVKLGRKQGKIVEVLKGLEVGDEIIKEEKKDDKE